MWYNIFVVFIISFNFWSLLFFIMLNGINFDIDIVNVDECPNPHSSIGMLLGVPALIFLLFYQSTSVLCFSLINLARLGA